MIKLNPIPDYYYQGDSQIPRQAWRMCFSSTCAMLVRYLTQGIPAANGDDHYLRLLQSLRVGDTTEYTAQLATLKVYGIKARFVKNASWDTLNQQLAKGYPVPVGWLHHGHVSRPTGGGHWSLVIGADAQNLWVHDPAGEADLVNGGYC